MYKLLLCWRYLLTRYLALVCIVSVLLGVATLIVVNSVMAGFSSKLRDRLHGALSDIVVQSWDYTGFDDPTGKMEQIRSDPELNDRIEAMTPTVEIFAMFQFRVNGTPIVRAVRLIGIDPESRARLGGFADNLGPANREHPSFDLSAEALDHYRERHPNAVPSQPPRRRVRSPMCRWERLSAMPSLTSVIRNPRPNIHCRTFASSILAKTWCSPPSPTAKSVPSVIGTSLLTIITRK
jgi:hypothetical protein